MACIHLEMTCSALQIYVTEHLAKKCITNAFAIWHKTKACLE